MAMGECSACSTLQSDLKFSLQFCLRVGGHLALTNQSELLHDMAGAIDDSTINIVVVIIIIIIIIS